MRYEIQIKVAGKWTTHGVVEDAEGAEAAHVRKTWDYLRGTVTVPARLVTHDYKGRVKVIATQGQRHGYRVTYGETLPVWSRILPSKAAADAFAAQHRSFGDVIFAIEAV